MLVMGLRAGVLIGSSLIFSIGGTLLIMSFFGVGLNRTSLAGFIIAMGMLVDNAIVVTDNAQIAIARGVNRRKALIDGATGPQWGLLGATFIAIRSFFCGGDSKTAFRGARHIFGIELGTCTHADHSIR